jgi:hypothetical protein
MVEVAELCEAPELREVYAMTLCTGGHNLQVVGKSAPVRSPIRVLSGIGKDVPLNVVAELRRQRVRKLMLCVPSSIVSEVEEAASSVFVAQYARDDAAKPTLRWTVVTSLPSGAAANIGVSVETATTKMPPNCANFVLSGGQINTTSGSRYRLPLGVYTFYITVTDGVQTQQFAVITVTLSNKSGSTSDTEDEAVEPQSPPAKRARVEEGTPAADVNEDDPEPQPQLQPQPPSLPKPIADLIAFATEQIPEQVPGAENTQQKKLRWLIAQLNIQMGAYWQLCRCVNPTMKHHVAVVQMMEDTIKIINTYIEEHAEEFMETRKCAVVQAALNMSVSAMCVATFPL